MAATIQTHHAPFPRHRRLPSDPLNESIYNLVTRPEDDRPPPLYKSRFAQQVRAEHLAVKRSPAGSVANGGNSASMLPLSSSSWSPGYVPPREGRSGGSAGLVGIARPSGRMVASGPKTATKTATGLYVAPQSQKPATATQIPRADSRRTERAASKPIPKSKIAQRTKLVKPSLDGVFPASRPISKPTSGRIAMAAEKRSNASTPVVADPLRWDNVAADEAEAEILNKFQGFRVSSDEAELPLSKNRTSTPPLHPSTFLHSASKLSDDTRTNDEDEVPEELNSSHDDDNDTRFTSRLAGPPREMSSSSPSHQNRRTVRPAHVGKTLPTVSSAQGGGGNRRMLPEAERLVILAGLKANHGALMELYNRMSVSVDTISKVNRKASMEKQLQLLEEDIKKFSHANIIVDA